MPISNFFSASFLFSIAIIVILIGGIFAYINFRIIEQDNKLTHMVNLVSLVVKDLKSTNAKITTLEDNYQSKQPTKTIKINDLISVSDNGIEYDENTISRDESDSHLESDNDSDVESESDSDSDSESRNDSDELKQVDLDQVDLDQVDLDQVDLDQVKTINLNSNNLEQTDILPNNIETDISKNTNTNGEIKDDDLKNINFSDLGQDIHVSKPDYKKMSLNKLRELVVDKQILQDASKLKKSDILEILLGDDKE